eukprot:TRINITY_DN1763_c0_g1_i1.p1 TRINITY_DN1763_c0_g1~~TRINITY_DN1763_c0_g1_i1.p1  ORF type:complete len:337 (-),score=122.72 TRINITY_DN1763_c0_g1_i1:142-1152(-)
MSHSSGIPVSSELKQTFTSANSDSQVRFIQARIVNDEIVPVLTGQKQSSGDQDLGNVVSLLKVDEASYVIYRFDDNQHQWALFRYVPDRCKVKDKMLYASTVANLKQQLGNNFFVEEVHGTVPDDFSEKGYKHHTISKMTEAPLTEREQIKKAEAESGEIYSGGASTYVHGVSFPVETSAMDAIRAFLSGSVNYIQVAIDCQNEKIIADHSGIVDVNSIQNEIPKNEPRFHFFAYEHQHEGQTITSNVFVFSCPDGSKGTKSAPVRMRMLYSASKANVGELLVAAGGKIDARFEVNAPEDFIEDDLVNQLHPKVEKKESSFSKPSRPGKGARKLIR